MTLVAVAAISLAAYALTFVELDLGWVLDNGLDTLARGIPRTNDESFLEPGHPVVMHSWAANVLFAVAQLELGGAGIAWMHGLLVLLVAVCCGASCWQRAPGPLPAATAALFGMLLVPYAFLYVRAQLFSCAFLPVVVAVVMSRSPRGYLGLMPLLALWANVHGGFVLGLALALGGLGIEASRAALGRESRLSVRGCLALATGLVAATLLNPWGPAVYGQASSSSLGGHTGLLTEWYPAWHPAVLKAAGWQYLALTLAAAAASWRLRHRPEALLTAAAVTVLAYSAVRHARLAPLALAPLIAETLAPLTRRVSTRGGGLVVGAVGAVGLMGIVARADQLGSLHTPAGVAPATVLAMLAPVPEGTRVWNDFDIGGALVFSCPQCRLAIDGRAIAAYSGAHLVDMLQPADSVLARRIEASGVPIVITLERALVEGLRGYRRVMCDGYCLLVRDEDPVVLAPPPESIPFDRLFQGRGRPFP